MTQVLDYSAGFPGAQAIRAAGYAGAVRYIGFPDRRKCATAGELADFTACGRGMAVVFEDSAAEWRGGRAAGARDGVKARSHATAVGFPTARPIYFAVDQDVVASGEFETMLDYLRGAGDVLGAGLVGVYGEADVIDRARDAGAAKYFWQTAAWSRGRRTAANVFQHVGTVYVGGIACDINDALTADWGQHNYLTLEGDVAFTDKITVASPGDRNYKESDEAAKFIGDTYFWTSDMYKAMQGVILPAVAALVAGTGEGLDQAAVMARIDTAVREATGQAMAGTVLPALQRVLAEVLGADNAAQADAIVTALAARLAA